MSLGYAVGIERLRWTRRSAELPVQADGAAPLRILRILRIADLPIVPGQPVPPLPQSDPKYGRMN